jgi:hypothetical protein
MSRFLAIALGLTVVFLSGALADATENSTGAVRVDEDDSVACIAANAGSGNINNVQVRIQFNRVNGSDNGDASTTCPTVAPSTTCVALEIGIPFDFSAFCEVTFPSGKVRGTLCNVTKHLCSDTR